MYDESCVDGCGHGLELLLSEYSVDDGRPSHWIQLEKAPFTIALHCAVAFDSYLWLIGGQLHYDGLLDNYSLGTESIKRKVGTFILQAYFKHVQVKMMLEIEYAINLQT